MKMSSSNYHLTASMLDVRMRPEKELVKVNYLNSGSSPETRDM